MTWGKLRQVKICKLGRILIIEIEINIIEVRIPDCMFEQGNAFDEI